MSYNELEKNFFVQELNFINLYKKGIDPLSACMVAFKPKDVKEAQDILSMMDLEQITSEDHIKKLEKTVELMREYADKEEPTFRR